MNDRFASHDGRDSGLPSDSQESEAFSTVPQVFLSGMSPERFRAMQQLYETAFEMARQKVTRLDEEADQADWLGDGI